MFASEISRGIRTALMSAFMKDSCAFPNPFCLGSRLFAGPYAHCLCADMPGGAA